MDLKISRANTSESYDISFTDGKLDVVNGIEEIGNRYLFGFAVYEGENFFDPTYGVDYHNNVFGRSTDDNVVIDELKAAALDTRGSQGIDSFSLTQIPETRTAELEVQARTSEGAVNLTTTINI